MTIDFETNLNIILDSIDMPNIDPYIVVQPHNFHRIIKPAEPDKTMVANLAIKEVILYTIRHQGMDVSRQRYVLKHERENAHMNRIHKLASTVA